ncbi:MAG: RNA methyltransferase [bacterium]
MKAITSPANPNVKRLSKLRSRKGRAESDTFLVEGFSIIEEALSSMCKIRTIIVEEKQADSPSGKLLISRAERAGAEVLILTNPLFKKISSMDTPQGVAAEVARPETTNLKRKKPKGLSLLVERLRDPRNMGLLSRTALAAGVEAVYLSRDSVDPFHPFAVQASMGAVLHLSMHTDFNAADVIEYFRTNGGETYATAPREGISPAEWKPKAGPVLLVLGNESRGVSPEVQQLCVTTITIPISPKAESLNIAVAAGVLCFQYKMKDR